MSLLRNLIKSISSQGAILENELGDDIGHLFEPTPWQTYDKELPPRPAWEASQKLIADCEELIALLTPTKIKLVTECISNNSTVGLGVAVEFGIADKIIENGGEASLIYLAEQCNTDMHKLGCIMHMLCQRHIFVEVRPDIFRNNRHSYELRKETGAGEMMLLETEEGYKSGLGWLPVLKDPSRMHDIDPRASGFSEVYNIDTGVLPFLDTTAGKSLKRKWDIGVPWLSSITTVATKTDLIWDSYGDTICDVGCGPGYVMLQVKTKYPRLKIVCQDLEQMIGQIRNTFRDYTKELENGDIQIKVHDYFTPQDTIADVYWLRGVIRDYDDETAAKLLSNFLPALRKRPGAKVLVNELYIPRLLTSPSSAARNAPVSERLPDFQSGYPNSCHMMELSTTILMGGKERTFEDIAKIGEAAGLKVSRFHQFRMFTGAIEFELA